MKKILILISAAMLFACSQNDSIVNNPTVQFVGNRQILLLHHSVGSQVMPYLRPMIANYNNQNDGNIEMWDDNGYQLASTSGHYYGGMGMPGGGTGSDFPQGYSTVWNMPLDNDGIMENPFERIMLPNVQVNSRYGWRDTLDFDAIIVKTCFVSMRLYLEPWVARDSAYYVSIRNIMDQHPEKRYIIMTPPPLVIAVCGGNPVAISNLRSRMLRLLSFLRSPEFSAGHNVTIMDLHAELADNDPSSYYYAFLRVAYGGNTGDSHPNIAGRQAAAQGIMNYLTNVFEE